MNRKMKWVVQWISIASAFVTGVSGASAAEFKTLLGMEYSTGKYGTQQSTNIWYYHATAQYETDDWVAKLTLPYVRITGSGSVAGMAGNGTPVVVGGGNGQTSASGQGDVIGALSYNLLRNAEQSLLLDVTGKVKFATADAARGLGSGKNDYSIQLDATQQQADWTFFGSVGYRKMGDTSSVNFSDPWFASLGSGYVLNAATQLGVAYDVQQAAVSGGAPISELMLFSTYALTTEHTLQGYVIKGFSDGSPAWGLGAVLNSRF